jgi:arylsulfatase A-like enzyme
MKQKCLLTISTIFLAFVTTMCAAVPVKPSIIFVMADDVESGDFQCYSHKGKIPTPNIDRLAREGMGFTDAHAPAALCSPTLNRASG